MSIFQLLCDESAQRLSTTSLVPNPDTTMSPLEALGFHDAGNIVVVDGRRGLFSRLFAAFPVVAAITSHLALDDIDALALTSKQTRSNLLPFRNFIVTSSLLCENDKSGPNILGWYYACARDFVTVCRRTGCSANFCRNCAHQRGFVHTAKRSGGPAEWEMELRYRRLCELCQKAPLRKHNHPEYHYTAPPHQHMFCDCGRRSIGCFCDTHSAQVVHIMENSLSSYYSFASFISPLCNIHSDSTPTRRKGPILARYDGMPCARGTHCLAARLETRAPGTLDNEEYEVNVPSSPGLDTGIWITQHTGDTAKANTAISPLFEPRIIAASIKVTEDEAISSHGAPPSTSSINKYFMCAEKEGRVRSQCAWCHRIVPSARDKQKYHLR